VAHTSHSSVPTSHRSARTTESEHGSPPPLSSTSPTAGPKGGGGYEPVRGNVSRPWLILAAAAGIFSCIGIVSIFVGAAKANLWSLLLAVCAVITVALGSWLGARHSRTSR